MARRSKDEQERAKREQELYIARAEYIRDFAEELALMADELKLPDVGRALQEGALRAHNAAERMGAAERKLPSRRFARTTFEKDVTAAPGARTSKADREP